jgi:crossover junction endodeoxyribonuclease RuvC
MLTLGIDPGTATTGYGLVRQHADKLVHVHCGVITTTPKDSSQDRLRKIHTELKQLISEHKPTHMAVERLFFGVNTKTAMAVGQARGIVLLTAAEHGLPVIEYTPLEVKVAVTGYGKAEKKQIQQMVKFLLKMADIPKPDDAADALAVAICHLHSHKMSKAALAA